MAKKGQGKEKSVIELIIDGRQAEVSLKNLRANMVSVERELNKMKKDDDPAGWKEKVKTLQKLRQAHADITTEIRGGEGSLNRFKTSWKEIAQGFVGGSLLMRGIDLLRQGFRRVAEMIYTVSDELANVSKTTGLTQERVRILNSELQKINTRTATSELRSLAEEAGRLGYSAEKDILGFVRASDQIEVALGDVLGEGATLDIAKLVDIFKTDEIYGLESALLRTGSALNELGMASTANEGYMVDFAKRMSGIANVANVSIEETLALAATLDSLGQSSEVSSTALSKVLVKMGSDVPTYAKMAGKSVDEFREILKRSSVEGLMLVLENVGKTTDGIEKLSSTLGDLGLDGGRVTGVFGTLSKNIATYNSNLKIATTGTKEATSVTNEFIVKNTNAAAIWDKIVKKAVNFGENIALSLEPAIYALGVLTGAITKAEIAVLKLSKKQSEIAEMDKTLVPLVKRYSELASEVDRTAGEESELQSLIKQIGEIVPSAVSEWSKYGDIMAINTQKVWEHITAERELLRAQKERSVEKMNQELERNLNKRQAILEKLRKQEATEVVVGGELGSTVVTRSATSLELSMYQSQLKEVNRLIQENETALYRLLGYGGNTGFNAPSMKSLLLKKDLPKGNPDPEETGIGRNSRSKTEADESIKEYERLQKAIEEAENEILIAKMSTFERELKAVHDKFSKLREMAKGHTNEMVRIAKLEADMITLINQRQLEAIQKEIDDFNNAKLEKERDAAKTKEEVQEAERRANLTQNQRDFEDLNSSYKKQIDLLNEHGLDTTLAYVRWATAVDKTIPNDKDKKEVKFWEGTVRDQISAYTSLGDAISGILEVSASNREENAKFEAQMATFQIAIESGVAIAKAVTLAASSSKNVWTLIAAIGGAIATVTSGIARARRFIEEAKAPEAPAFRADGGPTDLRSIYMDKTGNPEGYVNRPTFYQLGRRSYVAGEAGQEYVISNPMLKNPAVADFVSMLEALRQQRFFAAGGYTGPAAIPDPNKAMPSSDPAILSTLMEQNRLLKQLVAKPAGINYRVFEEYEEKINSIRGRASA